MVGAKAGGMPLISLTGGSFRRGPSESPGPPAPVLSFAQSARDNCARLRRREISGKETRPHRMGARGAGRASGATGYP